MGELREVEADTGDRLAEVLGRVEQSDEGERPA
jgi:hypothetical protein